MHATPKKSQICDSIYVKVFNKISYSKKNHDLLTRYGEKKKIWHCILCPV